MIKHFLFLLFKIWITAKKQGKRTGAYFWVGSDVNISGNLNSNEP